MQRLIWTRGFDMTERLSFPGRGTYPISIAYRAPQRLRTADLQDVPGWKMRVQVARTLCTWSTGPTAHRIYCSGAIWDDGAVARKVTTDLLASLLAQADFERATTPADQRSGLVRIAISAPESPPLCPPRSICGGTGIGFNPHGRYRATLLVFAGTGLPLSFVSTITLNRHSFIYQHVSFSYRRLAPISLPKGKHIRCPYWAASGQWCLVRR